MTNTVTNEPLNLYKFRNTLSELASSGMVVIVAVLSVILLFSACAKESTETVASAGVKSKPDIQKMEAFLIEEFGLPEYSIQATDDYLIVEGDVLFPTENFWKNYSCDTLSTDRLKKHYRYQYLVRSVTKISVNIDALPSAWKTAFQSAFTKWNNLGGKLKFQQISGVCPAYGITVLWGKLSPVSTIAMGNFPNSNGYPGSTITVSSSFSGTTSSSQKLYTAVHELGHTIGILHTDVSSGYKQILTNLAACNTGTDPYSVMRQGNISFSDFSTCDKAAYKVLYPK